MATKNSINNVSQDLTVDPGASGDSFVQFDINATGEFRIGVDDTDGDEFKISQGSALGTNDTVTITPSGAMRQELTPAVETFTPDTSNVTGDGTVFTVDWSTEIFDQGSNMSGTTFTAPVTGRYRIMISIRLGDMSSSHTAGDFGVVTSNRTYKALVSNYQSLRQTGSLLIIMGTNCILADMDASDTATAALTVSGGALTVDISTISSTDPRNGFFCNLAA
jgi:hypothetical protein